MREKLSILKMKIYCFVVNRNVYVRDAYQLPVDLDMQYHQKHRIKELFRLMGLLLKYRILKRKPSDEELARLDEMRAKKACMLAVTAPKAVDVAAMLRTAVTDAIDKMREADLVRFSECGNIVVWGNGSGSNMPELVRKVKESPNGFKRKYRFVWLKNQTKEKEISTFITFYYPEVLMNGASYHENAQIVLTDDERRLLSRLDFLQQSAEMILCEQPQADEVLAKLLVHEIFRYFSAALEYLKPKFVFIWDESKSVLNILNRCCDENKIPCTLLYTPDYDESGGIEDIAEHRHFIERTAEYIERVMMEK